MLKSESIRQVIRFGVVGVAVMFCFMALNWLFGRFLSPQAAFFAAYPPALVLHFLLNKLWTFDDRRATSVRHLAEYLYTVVVTFLIQWPVFVVCFQLLGWKAWFAAGVANVAQMTASFLFMRLRVFTPRVGVAAEGPFPVFAARHSLHWLVTAATLLVLLWYAYATGRTNPQMVTREPQAYYEMLTEAVLAGRTYLKLEPDPRLATLANPWAGAQGIPRAHDATYFNGRYYLYFGVAPVILLLAPWRLVTGVYLSDSTVIGVFLAFGFLLAVGLYLRFRGRFFPGLSPGGTALGVLTLGLGSFMQFEIWGAQFYQVPIACAFVCVMAAAHAVLSAVTTATKARQLTALACASFFLGCAVGSRPNFILNLIPLAGVGIWLAYREKQGGAGRLRIWAVLLATALPAALIGAGLGAYNWVRFGDILEFGLRHQFAAIDMHHFKLFGWWNLQPAAFAYLLSPPQYSLYYPFIRISDATFGLIPWAPFALGALLFPLAGWIVPRRRDPAWWCGLGFCLSIGLINLGTLLFYGYYLERYELDFVIWLMFVAAVAVPVALEASRGRIWRRGASWVAGVALVWTLIHSVLHGLPDRQDWPEVISSARVLNRLSAGIEKLAGLHYGPIAVELKMPNMPVGRREPLLSTGGGRDAVFAQCTGPNRFRWGFSHLGEEGVLGEEVTAVAGESYLVELDLGGLYPPWTHPVFKDWSQTEHAVLGRRVQIRWAGRTVLRAESLFYASDPLKVSLGSALPTGLLQPKFSGRIEHLKWLGLPTRQEIAAGLGRGPVRLRVKFPEFRAMVGEPLVSTGRHGAGDMIYSFRLGPDHLRFAHDSWGSGQFEAEPLRFDPSVEHVIDVDFGGLHPAVKTGVIQSGELQLRFDGREIVRVRRPFNPARADEVSFGYNAIRASTADLLFRGEKIMAERLESLPAIEEDSGPLALTLRLPDAHKRGGAEPLLVTGRPGAGDFVYLVYLPDGRVRIGYDFWGVGGPLSEPIDAPPSEPLLVQVSLATLYRPDAALWRTLDARTREAITTTVRVQVNGRKVLEAPTHPFPATPREVYVGSNPLGGSTCGEKFTGEILLVQRVDASAGW